MRIQIKDSRGWEKCLSLATRDLWFIGGGLGDDIRLDGVVPENGKPVKPRHAQLLDLKIDRLDGKPMLRLINLSQDLIKLRTVANSNTNPDSIDLPLFSKADLVAGCEFEISSYTLRLLDDAPTGTDLGTSPTRTAPTRTETYGDIGLTFELSADTLVPNGMVQGAISVQNNGPRKAAQFQLAAWLDGAPNSICQLSTTSFSLYPGASQVATLWVRHTCGPTLMAADHVLAVRVEAPGAYPNQTEIATRTLKVLPCFEHELRLKA